MGDTVLLLTSKSGAGTSLEGVLVRHLRDHGVSPLVACGRHGPLVEEARARKIPVEILPGLKDWRTPRGTLLLLPTLWRLRQMIHRHRVALIHSLRGSATPIALLLSRFTGIPHLCHMRFIYGTPAKYRKFWLCRAHAVVAVSHAALDSYLAACGPRPPARVAVVHSGIDAKGFEASGYRVDLRRHYGIPRDAPVAGIVGSLDSLKSPQTFIRAAGLLAAQFPSLQLLFVGKFRDPGYRCETLSLVNKLGLTDRCHFVGHQANPSPFFRAMDLLVHPSRSDAFPLVLLEAMAHGKPIVASRVGGIPEAVQDGVTGLLVPPGDHEELARAIGSLMTDSDRRRLFGERGRRRVEEEFSLERHLGDILRLYSEIAQK